MKKRKYIILLLIIILLVINPLIISARNFSNTNDLQINEEEEITETIENLVYSFGDRLKNVSLLAPREELIESITKNYSDLVSPTLLNHWLENPSEAPGRLTSSPWPERIEILEMKKTAPDEVKVIGYIIEITSTYYKDKSSAFKRPVGIIVKNIEGNWLIDKVIIGKYK